MRKLPKILRPEVGRWCARSRLDGMLAAGLQGPVTWLASPAGSGKTCLVAGYLAQCRREVVWLHLDRDDTEPATFFHYLQMAARVVRRRIVLPALRPEYRQGLETFTRHTFRELLRQLPEGTVIVLDNYEALEDDAELHALLADALLETPGDLAWMILSRREPPAAFARLRAAGKLTRLGYEALGFTLSETHDLVKILRGAERVPSADWLERLHAVQQGWAAGIVLASEAADSEPADAGRSPSSRSPLSGREATFDYFASEVFGRLDERRRHFLMQTACLPQLTVRQARELTGERDAQGLLEDLARRNYFTFRLSGGTKDRTYRYHPLFRQFLLEQAEARLDSAAFDALQARASRVLAASGQYEAAIELLREQGRWEELCGLVRKCAGALIEQGRHEVLNAWLLDVPEGLADEERGWLLYHRATARLPFDPSEARESYAQAFRCFARTRDAEGLFLSWAGVSEALLYGWGSFRDYDHWLEALEVDAAGLSPPTLAVEARLAATVHGALMFRRPDDPAIGRWERKVRHFLSLSRVLDPNHYVLLAINLFHHDLWRGRTARAKALLDSLEGAVRSRRIGPVAVLAWHTMRGVYGHFTGDGRASVESAEAGLAFAEECGVHFWDFLLLAQGAFGALMLEEVELAQRHLDRMRELLHPDRQLESLLFHDAAAQTALARGDRSAALESSAHAVEFAVRLGAPFPEAILRVGASQTLFACGSQAEALEELDRAEALARSVGSSVLLARCHLARAEYALRRGERSEALRALAEGFALCREHGYHGTPWWRTDSMIELAALALEADIEPEFVRRLIERRGWVPKGRAARSVLWAWPVRVFTTSREFRVVVGSRTIGLEGKVQRRPLELLQALVALGGRQVPEARVAEALWPDSEGDAGAQAVATTLHRLRRLIGVDVILRRDQKLSIDRERCFVDCFACEEAWADGTPVDWVADTLPLYERPFLSGSDVAWLLPYRQRLAARFAAAVERRATHLLAAGEEAEAVSLYRRACEIEPATEALHRSLIASLQRLGREAEAADAYRRCAESLRLHHGCEPSAETSRLVSGPPVARPGARLLGRR